MAMPKMWRSPIFEKKEIFRAKMPEMCRKNRFRGIFSRFRALVRSFVLSLLGRSNQHVACFFLGATPADGADKYHITPPIDKVIVLRCRNSAKDEDEIYWIPATFTAPTKHTNQETDLIQKSTEV